MILASKRSHDDHVSLCTTDGRKSWAAQRSAAQPGRIHDGMLVLFKFDQKNE